MCGLEFEWFNFARTAKLAGKKGVDRRRSRPAVRLLAAARQREPRILNALLDRDARVPCADRGLHTETGPGVYEAAIQFSEAAGSSRPRPAVQDGAKEIGARFGIMPSFMAKWSAQYPAAAGTCTSRSRTVRRTCFMTLVPQPARQGVRELSRRAACGCARVAPDVLAHREHYKRLSTVLGAHQTTWGIDNRHGRAFA